MTELRLKRKYFDEIASGKKTMEGRLMRGKICKLQLGDTLTFINDNAKIETIITKITLYKNFKTGLEHNDLSKVLPGVASVREGVKVYKDIYGDEDEQYGFCLISFILSDCAELTPTYKDSWLNTLYTMDREYYDSDLSKDDVLHRHQSSNMLYVVKNGTPQGYIEYKENTTDGSVKIVWIYARGIGRCAIEKLKQHFKNKIIYANISIECNDRASKSKARLLLFQDSNFKVYDITNEGTGYIHIYLKYDPYA
jgi:ASC-1-like (ASCH) protein